jgi:hypothetical protein
MLLKTRSSYRHAGVENAALFGLAGLEGRFGGQSQLATRLALAFAKAAL